MLRKALQQLDRQNDSQLQIEVGPGNLPLLVVRTPQATATISIYAGQVLSYQPTGQEPVLWTSRKRYAQMGQAIRGGIPICWPWFGVHPTESDYPSHGFARTQDWCVVSTDINAQEGSADIVLKMEPGKASQSLWNYDCRLTQNIHVGDHLSVELVTQNRDGQAVQISEALHTYFSVRDIRKVSVRGLDQQAYVNNLARDDRGVQDGPLRFSGEIENFYVDHGPTCWIEDEELERTIRIDKRGSRSTVVWNPWIDKCAATRDMADDEYLQMLCIETANIKDNVVTVPPGQSHSMRVTIGVVS